MERSGLIPKKSRIGLTRWACWPERTTVVRTRGRARRSARMRGATLMASGRVPRTTATWIMSGRLEGGGDGGEQAPAFNLPVEGGGGEFPGAAPLGSQAARIGGEPPQLRRQQAGVVAAEGEGPA